MTSYHIQSERVSLAEVRERIEATDLVPSRASLLDGIDATFATLMQHGVETLAEMRAALKAKKHVESTAAETGLDREYLVLLRREVEGWFPKPFKLAEFDWLPAEDVAKLEDEGLKTAAQLYEVTRASEERAELARSAGVDSETLDELARYASLTRVQWVSPLAARMLVDAQCESVTELAQADAEELRDALARINEGDRYFKGSIGLRDVHRLVRSAGYVVRWAPEQP